MSYLDRNDRRFNWITTPAHSSAPHDIGCVQCGALIEPSESGSISLSGKCFNCISWVSEDDEMFEELDG